LPAKVERFEFSNGLTLLVEPVAGVQSAACTVLVPAGADRDDPEAEGTANILADLVGRGAGAMDSRQLTTALDNLGVTRSENAELTYTSFVGASLAGNLVPALELITEMIRRPALDEEQFEFCLEGARQELLAIEDDPAQKLFIHLRRRVLPGNLGRAVQGTKESLERITIERVRSFHERWFRPDGAIIGIAGAVDPKSILEAVERLFGDWQPKRPPEPVQDVGPTGSDHLVQDKTQTHIGLSFPAVPVADPDYYSAHGAIGVLSGGMSSRLFTEVREKRGLCYSVSASFVPLKKLGIVLAHAGSTNERAQETLDVMVGEFRRLREGIDEAELDRVKAGLKSATVMQEESTSARAGVLARSTANLGRVRTVEETLAGIDGITVRGILEYLERHPPGPLTVVTLGPRPLETPK
jgi:predicted Zn-dependent peptidase